jgi:CRP/FNR family transcriptional regulator, cyclic AMP receptor protein
VTNPSSNVFLEICADAPTELFSIGEPLMRQGEIGDHSFVIVTGMVCIEVLLNTGLRRCVASRGPGELVGELSLFETTRSATVIAVTECVCVRISHAALLQLLAGRQAFGLALLAAVMKKARDSSSDQVDEC